MLQQIDNLVDGTEGEQQIEELPRLSYPKHIKMSRYAIKKASAICRATQKLYGAIEWYALLLSKPDTLRVAEDLLIPKQVSSAAHTRTEAQSLAKALEEMRTGNSGYVPVGWIHSHGGLSTFFSSTDDENIETVLQAVCLNTMGRFQKPMKAIEGTPLTQLEGSRLLIAGSLPTDLRVEMRHKPKEALEDIDGANLELEIFQPVFMSWSYNVVVNNAGDHHSEIAIRQETPFNEKVVTRRYDASVKMVDSREFVRKLDEDALRKEVKDKVKQPYVPKVVVVKPWWNKFVPSAYVFGGSAPGTVYSGSIHPVAAETPAQQPESIDTVVDTSPVVESQVVAPAAMTGVSPEQVAAYLQRVLVGTYTPKEGTEALARVYNAYVGGVKILSERTPPQMTCESREQVFVTALTAYANVHPEFAGIVGTATPPAPAEVAKTEAAPVMSAAAGEKK